MCIKSPTPSVHDTLYSNLPFEYTLWTIGAHLVGRCVLYLYCFLDPLIRWIATGNGWNLRQNAWPKPNDVKSLQSWANQTRQASENWGRSMKSLNAPSRKSGTIGRTYSNEIQLIETFVESKSATNFKGLEALHNNVLNIDDQTLCSNIQMEAEQMYDELRRSIKTFQWNIKKLTLNFNCNKFMHSWQMTMHDIFKQ